MSDSTEVTLPNRYRKRPVVIEAVQYDESNAYRILTWIGKHGGDAGIVLFDARHQNESERIDITTLEGTMTADLGDWIIRGVAGEFYPCKPEIFSATYEAVES